MARQQTAFRKKHEAFQRALILSALLHIGVILFLSIGMPFFDKPPQNPETVNVELVDAEDVAQQAKAPAAGETDSSSDNSRDSARPKPESPPKQIERARPPQAPKVDMSKPPAPKQNKQEQVHNPAPEPAPRKPVPPDPEPDNEDKEQQQQNKKAKDKQETEKAEKQFQSVLKNLAEPAPVSEEPEDEEKRDEKDKNKDKDKNSGTKNDQSLASRAERITMSEKQALRQQLSQCWNVLAGAKNARDLVVRLRLHMNPDRTVRKAELLDKTRYDNNPQFRAAADSALRAVQNPKCSPLKLPPEKYDQWKIIMIRFDPEEML